MKKSKKEFCIGIILLIIVLLLGFQLLASDSLVYRMLIGLALGYTLTRSMYGFAGMANRAYHFGSTQLIKAIMLMIIVTVIPLSALFYSDPSVYNLSVNPINFGLFLGAFLFGIGMSFSMCCASGVLTDLAESPSRALVTLLFFGIGVFVGFPIAKQSWITTTFVSTASYEKGVFLPDLFQFDGYNGFFGAVLATVALALCVMGIAQWYENKRKKEGTYSSVPSELLQANTGKESLSESGPRAVCSEATFNKLFVNPWSLTTGAFVLAMLFVYMTAKTGSGWGASTPVGYWVMQLMTLVGIPAEALASYSLQDVSSFTSPFFSVAMNIQNISIFVGALIALLLAGRYATATKGEWKLTFKDALLYIIGGFLMGFGTRLSNGCNVGAMYTPIANFSLSGWFFLVFMIIGGFAGNTIKKQYYKK